VAVAQTRFQNLWVSLDAAGGPLRGSRTPAARTHRAVEDLRAGFDRVILVSGRDHTGYAARRLYPLTDANIVIVRAEKTRAPAAKQVVETVLESGGDLLGVVFADRRYYVPEAVYRWF
jgi:hypothetical protein